MQLIFVRIIKLRGRARESSSGVSLSHSPLSVTLRGCQISSLINPRNGLSGPKAVSRRQAAGRAGPEGGREKDQPATSTWMRVQYKNINTFITCSYFLDLICF